MARWRSNTSATRWCIAASVLAAAVFAPTLRHGFVNWDDPHLILDNPRVTAASPAGLLGQSGDAYLPVRDLAWNLTYRVAGPSPFAFHLLNVVCHAVASGLFCLLIVELLGRGTALVGGVAGTVFAVHPLHVEPVAWASGLKDPLAAALLFAAFLLYLRAARADAPGRRAMALGAALALFWCAAMAKASALVLPVLMLLYVCALAPDRRRALGMLVPFILLAALTAWLTYATAEASGAAKVRTAPWGRVALTTLTTVGAYLRRLVLPVGLSPRYASGGHVAAAAAAVSAYGLLLAVSAARWRRLFFALAWLAAALLPYLNVVRTSTAQADRYLYVAVGAWAMAVGLAVEAVCGGRWPVLGVRRRWLAAGAAVVVVGAYAAVTVWQSRVWAGSERVWERALAVAPDDPLAHYLLGDAVWERQPRRAAQHFQRAADAHLEATARHVSGAGAASQRGDPALADRHLRLAAEHERLAADALAYLGTALRQAGDADAALSAHREAARLNPRAARFAFLVAGDLVQLRRCREALPHYEAAAAGPGWLRQEVRRELHDLKAAFRDSPDDVRAIDGLLRRMDAPAGPSSAPGGPF